MESKWRKVKMALGSNFCVYVPTADTDVSPPPSVAGLLPTTGDSPATSRRSWSPALRLSRSLSRSSSSKKCTICLASMKRGEGEAIFTAECAHSFHFQCIVSHVKHGNRTCPICRAKWKQIPQQGSTGLAPAMTLIRPPPRRQNSNRHISTAIFPAKEPAMFNDDEALDVQASNMNYNTSDGSYSKRVMLKTYTEVAALPRLSTMDDFTVLIHLKAPVLASARTPVDLVTVLDISGSMAGTKMALLKRAMGFVIQNLGPTDRLSVIVFSSTARRLFPLRKMTEEGKQHAVQAVYSLMANGGTNIAEGLRKGGKVMKDRREKNPVASIILLSDGQDTYTTSGGWGSSSGGDHNGSNHRLFVPQGIDVPVHAFGFGADHDAILMHSISETSGGTFSFIETESVILDAFAQCIGGLLSVVVKGLQVIIESASTGIRVQSLKTGSYRSHLTPDRESGCIDVGDLYADEERDFLVSINVPKGKDCAETLLLKVHCSYTDPMMTEETVKLVSDDVTIQRPETVGKENVVSVEVDRQKNRLQSAEAMEQARAAAEEGDLTRAVNILENFRKVLSGSVAARSGDRLCTALDAELKEMQERMASRRTYEHSGRAYMLSGLSSHTWQRATARGDSTDGSRLVQAYQTPSMTEMLTRSQAIPSQPAQSSLASQAQPRRK